MHETIPSIQDALLALADPSDPRWAPAFAYLTSHPETAAIMRETFWETLEQMGVEPSGTDPVSGEPMFTPADVAQAMGIPPEELDAAINAGGDGSGDFGPES